MSQDNQQGQPHVIGEMFDAANISQPVPPQGVPGSITPANIEIPAPRPQTPASNKGFTTDNLQPPAPTLEQAQEGGSE